MISPDNRASRLAALLILLAGATAGAEDRYAFIVSGDCQYLAEKAAAPKKLDPYSEIANSRFIRLMKKFPGKSIAKKLGGGKVSADILGLIVTGDLIDSLDKSGGNYPAMQRFEWKRFQADYGLKGGDGRIPWPVYELHGNHDGPQGDTFVIEGIIARNKNRPRIASRSDNGLHYSWDWGPLHLVNLGIFVGSGEKKRKDHHYAPKSSLDFLKKDLAAKVGASGRPVILSFHLHPFIAEYDWPKEDLAEFWKTINAYNVAALFHGHTHGSPPSRNRWNGKQFSPGLKKGLDLFNPDDAGASKTDRNNPGKGAGLAHGVLYVELIDRPGDKSDSLVVRSYATRDNWRTHGWHSIWKRTINIPAEK